MRFLPIGPRSVLVELDDLDQTLGLFDVLRADPVEGIAEIVPAARTLMIRTALGMKADGKLAGAILARQSATGEQVTQQLRKTVEVPVCYDGEDLADVADHMGLTESEFIAAHQEVLWHVAFCGFAPGFSYMSSNDERFDLPRRSSPRNKVPAGSVALAGRFCGIYPQETPGGWQLIGSTNVPMWDLSRDPPALLRPGMCCRFVQRKGVIHPTATIPEPEARTAKARTGLHVLSTAFPILFQDEGRAGQAEQGVSASGALDISALHRANRAAGNPPETPALEITLGPVRLKADTAMVLALAGAGQAKVDGQLIPRGSAFSLDAGDEMLITPPNAGMRSYLAMRGGFDVQPVLGSAATDTLAFVGPDPVFVGSVLAPANRPALAVAAPEVEPDLPKAGDLVELPVMLGPRTDWFPNAIVQIFLSQEWTVTMQSSRVGIRLEGGKPLIRENKAELPSEGTETGAIQVPHTGQPVLFLSDHPLTGGYPVIATLSPEALNLAGQIPPGARIRFTAIRKFEDISPESFS